MSTSSLPHPIGSLRLPLLNTKRGMDGPISRTIARRSILVLACMWLVGLALDVAPISSHWHALGIGLFLPGAGFLYTAAPIFFVVTVILFAVSILLWILLGMIVLLPLVWLVSAIIAGMSAGTGVWSWTQVAVPIAAVLLLLSIEIRGKLAEATARKKAGELNQYLVSVPYTTPVAPQTAGEELSDEDLGALRFTLDLALQPLDRFEGFTTKDQFREAAWRYQLNAMEWALGILHATRLPAFQGYLAEAERNTLLKATDKRVWSYWCWENLWGNLRYNPDPIIFANIMFSGYYALALGIYEAVSGDYRFDIPGSLPFRWNEKTTYAYDFPRIIEALKQNFTSAQLCLFPCEPSWTFTMCNEIAMAGMLIYDRLHGTGIASSLQEAFYTSLTNEFLTLDGRPVNFRSNNVGLAMVGNSPFSGFGNVWLLNMIAPSFAAQQWALLRHRYLERPDKSIELIPRTGIDKFDADYTSTGAFFYTAAMVSAREMGDEEVYTLAKRKYDELGKTQNQHGALRWSGSTFANIFAQIGRFGAKGAWYGLATTGLPEAWQRGPILEQAPYPDVLVARAVTDGKALDLVLRPGSEGGRYPLEIARLTPGVHYQVNGAIETACEASPDGRATLHIDLDNRHELHIRPVL